MEITKDNIDKIYSSLKTGDRLICTEETLDNPKLIVGQIYTVKSKHDFGDLHNKSTNGTTYRLYVYIEENTTSYYLRHFDFYTKLELEKNEELMHVLRNNERMLDI